MLFLLRHWPERSYCRRQDKEKEKIHLWLSSPETFLLYISPQLIEWRKSGHTIRQSEQKENFQMIIQIPLEESFLAPEGTFQGTCTDVRPTERRNKKGVQQQCIRLVFDLDPIDEGILYRVGRDFPVDDMKGFRDMLTHWLGGSIRGKELDTSSLIGKRATLQVVHIAPREHEEAFRYIQNILPPQGPLQQAA